MYEYLIPFYPWTKCVYKYFASSLKKPEGAREKKRTNFIYFILYEEFWIEKENYRIIIVSQIALKKKL